MPQLGRSTSANTKRQVRRHDNGVHGLLCDRFNRPGGCWWVQRVHCQDTVPIYVWQPMRVASVHHGRTWGPEFPAEAGSQCYPAQAATATAMTEADTAPGACQHDEQRQSRSEVRWRCHLAAPPRRPRRPSIHARATAITGQWRRRACHMRAVTQMPAQQRAQWTGAQRWHV